jgi:ribosome maturation protein Sdo1
MECEYALPLHVYTSRLIGVHSETDLDDVLQISNVFVNVSKGQAASTEDLQKAFGKTDVSEIVKEVRSDEVG